MSEESFWQCARENKPMKVGYYPVTVCYDLIEGFIPKVAYWEGTQWNEPCVCLYGTLCNTKQEAENLAYENDFEGN